MSAAIIREAGDEDLAAILDLYQAAGIAGGTGFSLPEAQAQLSVLKRYPSFRVFVALVESSVAGTYELLIMDNLAKRGRKAGIVEAVAVHPYYQGRGVGRAMMQHAMDQCRAAGCYKLTLSSNLVREDAHKFYDALGFERHGYSFRVALPD